MRRRAATLGFAVLTWLGACGLPLGVWADRGTSVTVRSAEMLPDHEAGQNRYLAARVLLAGPRGGPGVAELYVRRTDDVVLIVRAVSVSMESLERWRPDLQRLLASLTPVARAAEAPPAPDTSHGRL